jgi:cell division septum initiation protein DivIVA
MPDTVKSLKIENDELKNQVIGLKEDLQHFQDSMLKKLQDMPSKMATTSPSTNSDIVKSLDYLSDAYDDLKPFRTFTEK